MFSKFSTRQGLIAVVLLSGIVASACMPTEPSINTDISTINDIVTNEAEAQPIAVAMGDIVTNQAETQPIAVAMDVVSSNQYSGDEMDGLLYMREEEKLARDVYSYLYDTWGVQVFQNISQSEKSHIEAVRVLLDAYGLEDPASSTGVGEFVNPDLQDLYNRLIDQGSQSLKDALLVGAAIEEIDILDLEENIALTDKADIKWLYENLLQGSQNHLRAFVRSLSNQTEVAYAPQYLSQDQYDQMIGTTMGNPQNASASGTAARGRRGNPGSISK